MLHLATKAFWPGKVPFPVLHVDTGHNFPEVIEFRDRTVERLGLQARGRLASRSSSTAANWPSVPTAPATRCRPCRCWTRIQRNKFDAVFGGGRRDEDKARAKERILSLRDEFGQWDPRNQRPELWNLYNGRHTVGQHVRAFPISNWTELDVWRYIEREGIELPGLYYAHEREVFARDGMWRAVGEVSQPRAARGSHHQDRPLPHRGRHVLHRRRRIRTPPTSATSSSKLPPPPSPNVAPPGPMTASPRPPWKTARRTATSDEHRHFSPGDRPSR